MCLHIVALTTIYILPKFIRGEKRSTTSQLQNSSKTSIKGEDDRYPKLENCDEKLRTHSSADEKNILLEAESSSFEHKDMMPQLEETIKPSQLPSVAFTVPHDQCEMDHLSSKLMEKIEAETKNIEEFIDKTVSDTVTGIVEFKNDLMRDCVPSGGLRKRTSLASAMSDVVAGATGKPQTEESAAFLKKEIEVINAVVQQSNVLPAVLSNGGHAK